MLSLAAPAKLNLALDVLGRRPDGYHEVKMVLQSVDLADSVQLLDCPPRGGENSRARLVISREPGLEGEDIPGDERNLALQAARLLAGEYGVALRVEIRLHKRIPAAAGLGGGSADAAAVLKGLNLLWDLGRTPEELHRLAVRLGADVPFCLQGGTALAQGIGERLSPLRPAVELWFVLVKPPFGLSTAEVYRAWDEVGEKSRLKVEELVEALQEGDPARVGRLVGNALEAVVFPRYPVLKEIKEGLLALGALGAAMSGSGPTVFGLVEGEEQARNLAAEVARRRPEWGKVYAVRALPGSST
ncbi:MAG: 4-(cytidine 5'-diphospho)-2-C-methyl-D-erythritol kinase [Bacillota bacterium]|nr:4-(cytidine 5'-diphospho)-2-C-methyl-D-erythritol kinase [Bacillota bacterium]